MSDGGVPKFEPKPGIDYKYDYVRIFADMAKGVTPKDATLRSLVLTDLWFVVYFILGMGNANHKFVVDMCREIETGPKSHTLDIFAREHMKCVSAGTEIKMADGSAKNVEAVLAGDRVSSIGRDGKATIASVVAKEYNGFTDVVEIETEDGRKLSVTPNHRLMEFNTWKQASEFKVGDFIAIPAKTAREVKETMPIDEVKFLAYTIASGGLINGCVFKSASRTLTSGFIEVCSNLGFPIQVVNGYLRVGGVCISLLKKYGLYGSNIDTRRLPACLFQQPDDSIKQFLKYFWGIHGVVSIEKKKSFLSLRNVGMLEDIRSLLLSLGVNTTKTTYPVHTLHMDLTMDVCKMDSLIPSDWTKLLRGEWPILGTDSTPRKEVAMFAESEGNDELRSIVASDIRWSKVKYIRTGTKNHTYDLQVEDTQVFIANNIISHNTTVITIAETIQDVLKHPEKTHCIFSYIKPIAKRFVFTIKGTFENNKALIRLFPDVLYDNPQRDSPLWNLDDGIIVKRRTNRKEPTVSASGLTEGMVTGMHFEFRKYDDIVTEDIGRSTSVMEDVKLKFDSSENLGTDGGVHRVTGTFYHYDDPLVYIRNKKSISDPSKPAYHYRFKPATEGGAFNGKPVFLSQERLDALKLTKTYKCQQLLDPSPAGTKKLKKELLKKVEAYDVPPNLKRYLLVDPAGKKGDGDPWACVLVGVDVNFSDIRASAIYILKIGVFQTYLSQTIRSIVKMYTEGGKIMKLCVEQVGQSTAEVHISASLKEIGINISEDNGRLVIFTPRARPKEKRIESGLSWHLDNGRLYVADTVTDQDLDYFYRELDGFPHSKDDHCLDTISYFILDLLPKLRFSNEETVLDDSDLSFSSFL